MIRWSIQILLVLALVLIQCFSSFYSVDSASAATSRVAPTQTQTSNLDLGLRVPTGIHLIALAGGKLNSLPDMPGRFFVDRLTLSSGESVATRPTEGALVVLFVEEGAPLFVDDAGLEAPGPAGTQVVVPSNDSYTLRNDDANPAKVLRLVVEPKLREGSQNGVTAKPTISAEIAMKDIAFAPQELTIPANVNVTISVPNQGATIHDFNIDDLNAHSGNVTAGAAGSVTINAAPGDYQYYCSLPGHREAGMVGVLHVVESAAPAPVEPPQAADISVTSDEILVDAPLSKLSQIPAVVFIARVTFDPAATLGNRKYTGPIALIGEQGSLTITRSKLLPAVLGRGKGVVLSAGKKVGVENGGTIPAVALMVGVIASSDGLLGGSA